MVLLLTKGVEFLAKSFVLGFSLLSTQVTIKIADMELKPGEYVFGSHRTDEQTLEIKFYEAGTGKFLGPVNAIADKQRGPIRSLAISPPENGKASIKVGRFAFQYALSE